MSINISKYPGMPSESVLDDLAIGSILSWSDVFRTHKTQNGIYQRGGRLISLLTDFGRINPCYPDAHGNNSDTIYYTGNGRRGDQKLDVQNRALLDAIGAETFVPLFNKLDVNRWQFTGYWKVVEGVYVLDEVRDRMVWRFTLARLAAD